MADQAKRHEKRITPFTIQPDMEGKTMPHHDVKTVKTETASNQPTPYEFMKLNKRGGIQYPEMKAKFGSLALTDKEHSHRDQKASLFQLSPMLRGALKLEEEEQRAIQALVNTQVAKLAGLAQKEATDRGHKEGFEMGKAAAEKQFAAESELRLSQLDAFLQACETAKVSIFQQNEKFVIDTIFQVARMIVLTEIKTDRDYVIRLTKELIEKMGTKENVSILISSADLESATRIQEGLERAIGALQNLQIEASDRVAQGGCIVETQWNTIDARIETQLERIRENLGGLVRKTATVASETEGAPSVEETKTDDTAESPESSESPESKDPKDSA